MIAEGVQRRDLGTCGSLNLWEGRKESSELINNGVRALEGGEAGVVPG